MKRSAYAVWQGDPETDKGKLNTHSGVPDNTPQAFSAQFDSDKGTECFSMALSMIPSEAGLTPERIDTDATVTLQQVEGDFATCALLRIVEANVRGASRKQFGQCANDAVAWSSAAGMQNTAITMDATLAS